MNRNDAIKVLTGALKCTRAMKSPIVHISIPAVETIIELLKEQKPIETEEFEGTYYCCGCKWTVLKNDKFCAHCGRPINWYNGHMI